MGAGVLTQTVRTFLETPGIRRLFVAGGGVPPPRAQRTRFPRLLVVLQGQLPVETGGTPETQIRLEAGDALYSPEGAWDRPDWSAPCQTLNVLFGVRHIGLSLVTPAITSAPSVEKLSRDWPADGVLQATFGCLRSCVQRDRRTDLERHLVAGLLAECLAGLERVSNPEGKARHTYESLCLYIQAHLSDPLTRESVAEHFALSPNHVSRLFRQQGHHRFVDYLLEVRLEHARELLRESRLPIKEVAALAGFNDHAYFHRVFRKVIKLTPMAYRMAKD